MGNLMGTVASLHLHPAAGGQPMIAVDSISLVAEKGIVENQRYFDRRNRLGRAAKRQVSLIEREQISAHAAELGVETIPPGVVRSNIETCGIDLIALMGRNVQVGTAVLFFGEARTPCEKMDRIVPGLRRSMENDRQGVIAQVVRSGSVRVGDEISPLPE